MKWLIAWLLVINAVAWLLTVTDKASARRGGWRIPEATLFAVAILGGAPLMWLTMRYIRHKTRHRDFTWGLPLIIAAQCAILYIMWKMCP